MIFKRMRRRGEPVPPNYPTYDVDERFRGGFPKRDGTILRVLGEDEYIVSIDEWGVSRMHASAMAKLEGSES